MIPPKHNTLKTMNIEDIKVGETYNVRMKCVDDKENSLRSFSMETIPYICRLFDKKDIETCVFPLLPPEPAPKYDPCRPFRKGDKVRIITHKGRHYDEESKSRHLSVFSVTEDEEPLGAVELLDSDFYFEVDPAYLELVTPVEELEPYHVVEDSVSFNVVKGNRIPVFFCKGSHPHAKVAAESECARLNAEHRKEMEK
jgi:hypothetical protein